MKLTILRLATLTAQDRLDLAKIWPDEDISRLEAELNETHRLYVARFNDRLLAALKLEYSGSCGIVSQISVREVTRRRGVGQYLLEETVAQNGALAEWWVTDKTDDGAAAFMRACGFQQQQERWVK